MQLSLQMLRDHLMQYDPEADIRNNKRHLQSMRLFSESLRYSASTVYLMPAEQGKIVCSNENDILILHAEDVNEVSNEILDIFEFYRDMEDRAAARIAGGCTEKELLSVLAEMTGFFLILADASFYMRETAGPESFAEQHRGLKNMITEHMMPLSVLKKINAEPKIRMHGVPPYLIEVPGLGTACTANLFANGHHEGWLVACKDNFEFTQGEQDRLACAAEIMERWFENNIHAEEQSKKAGMLLDLLSGKNEKDSRIRDRMHTFGWMDADRKQVFVIRVPKFYNVPAETAGKRLEILFPDAFILRQGEQLILLVNYALNDEKKIRRQLQLFLKETGLTAGESRIFPDVQDLKEQSEAADTAAVYAEKKTGKERRQLTPDPEGTEVPESGSAAEEGKRIWGFADVAVPYMASVLKEHALSETIHPAVRRLQIYDHGHDSALGRTLRIFLEENCSHTVAARKLYIHRSTLLYRLERIAELTGTDLTDPEERLRLQLSFYMSDAEND